MKICMNKILFVKKGYPKRKKSQYRKDSRWNRKLAVTKITICVRIAAVV